MYMNALLVSHESFDLVVLAPLLCSLSSAYLGMDFGQRQIPNAVAVVWCKLSSLASSLVSPVYAAPPPHHLSFSCLTFSW